MIAKPATLLDRTFENITEGESFTTEGRRVTGTDVDDFARLSGDYHPEHMDPAYAAASPYGERIAHGLLVFSMATGQVNATGLFERCTIAVMEMRVRFVKAVRFNDTVRTVARIIEKRPTKKPDRGIVKMAVTVINQTDEAVLEGEITIMVKREGNGGDA
jgi:acyl dehydratase